MKYKEDIKSKLGLGLAALGRPGYINLGHDEHIGEDKSIDGLEKNAHEVLKLAWENGIKNFDAARSYGYAEKFLRSWIDKMSIGPEQIHVSSKWGYIYTADWKIKADNHEIKEHSSLNLQKQWSESKTILSNYLKLYQIHSATLESGVLTNYGVLTYLDDLKKKGLKIGFSVSGPNQSETIEKAFDIKINGRDLFDSVQVTWNLLENSTTATLKHASSLGKQIIIKEAMANGRLLIKDDPNRQALYKLSDAKGCSLDALCLSAVMHQPFVDIVLSGASNITQLSGNLEAMNIQLNENELDSLKSLREDKHTYWERRSKLVWN